MNMPMTVQDLLIHAIQLQGAGRLPEAVQLFDHVLAHDPLNAAALYSLGVIALGRNDARLNRCRRHGGRGEGLAVAALGEPDEFDAGVVLVDDLLQGLADRTVRNDDRLHSASRNL